MPASGDSQDNQAKTLLTIITLTIASGQELKKMQTLSLSKN